MSKELFLDEADPAIDTARGEVTVYNRYYRVCVSIIPGGSGIDVTVENAEGSIHHSDKRYLNIHAANEDAEA